MGGLGQDEAVAALGEAYRGVTALLDRLDEPDFLRPTLCLGWTVTDVVYHLLGDARRALTALATPAATEPDVDFVTYWEPWKPGGPDAFVRARAWRLAAAAVTAITGPAALAEDWQEAAQAAVRLAALAPYPVVATQGHALAVADFAGTLAVEATIHHLDMIAYLPSPPAPGPDGLNLVRRTLDGLLGATGPGPATPGWDDTSYALKGTGRRPLSPEDRAALGGLAGRFPLLG